MGLGFADSGRTFLCQLLAGECCHAGNEHFIRPAELKAAVNEELPAIRAGNITRLPTQPDAVERTPGGFSSSELHGLVQGLEERCITTDVIPWLFRLLGLLVRLDRLVVSDTRHAGIDPTCRHRGIRRFERDGIAAFRFKVFQGTRRQGDDFGVVTPSKSAHQGNAIELGEEAQTVASCLEHDRHVRVLGAVHEGRASQESSRVGELIANV